MSTVKRIHVVACDRPGCESTIEIPITEQGSRATGLQPTRWMLLKLAIVSDDQHTLVERRYEVCSADCASSLLTGQASALPAEAATMLERARGGIGLPRNPDPHPHDTPPKTGDAGDVPSKARRRKDERS